MTPPFLKVLYYFVKNYEGSKMFPYLQTNKFAFHSCLDTTLLGHSERILSLTEQRTASLGPVSWAHDLLIN